MFLQLSIEGFEPPPENSDRIGGPAGPGIRVESRPNGCVHDLDGRGRGDVGIELFRGDTRPDELLAPKGNGLLNDARECLSEIGRRMVCAEATIQKRPVAVDDQVVIRPMMYLALSYDHRIVDGREAVSFLVRIKESIENPERMMLEI